jgi:hypothetical protein
MPSLVRTSAQHSTAIARTPARERSSNSGLQVTRLQENAASPSRYIYANLEYLCISMNTCISITILLYIYCYCNMYMRSYYVCDANEIRCEINLICEFSVRFFFLLMHYVNQIVIQMRYIVAGCYINATKIVAARLMSTWLGGYVRRSFKALNNEVKLMRAAQTSSGLCFNSTKSKNI